VKLTREQLQGRKDKAARFTETVLNDPERASEIESESLEDYAERRHIQLLNPNRRKNKMAETKVDLQEKIDELEAENEALRDQLDAIADIVAPEDDVEGDEDDGDGDEDDDSEEDEDPEPLYPASFSEYGRATDAIVGAIADTLAMRKAAPREKRAFGQVYESGDENGRPQQPTPFSLNLT
jgi:hypothetical protein